MDAFSTNARVDPFTTLLSTTEEDFCSSSVDGTVAPSWDALPATPAAAAGCRLGIPPPAELAASGFCHVCV